MGICCWSNVQVVRTSIQEYKLEKTSVELTSGNILLESLDAIIIPSNPILKLGIQYISYESIKIQKDWINIIKSKGKFEHGKIFVTKGVQSSSIIHAVCPDYFDGTFGENDYLRSAYSSSLQKTITLQCKKIGISVDWLYPRGQMSKIVIEEIQKAVSLFEFSKILVFCNEVHLVFSKQTHLLKKELLKASKGIDKKY